MKISSKLILACISSLLISAISLAQQPACPPQRLIMKGFHVQASGGPAFWTANLGKSNRMGYAMQLQTGLDITSWLSLELSWSSGIQKSIQDFPPSQATFTTNGIHASVKLDVPIGRFEISLIGGAGILWIQPDRLLHNLKIDNPNYPSWLGGLRFVWHTYRRRVSLGIQLSAIGTNNNPDIWIIGSGLIGVAM